MISYIFKKSISFKVLYIETQVVILTDLTNYTAMNTAGW
jgi:hypothetical protein